MHKIKNLPFSMVLFLFFSKVIAHFRRSQKAIDKNGNAYYITSFTFYSKVTQFISCTMSFTSIFNQVVLTNDAAYLIFFFLLVSLSRVLRERCLTEYPSV